MRSLSTRLMSHAVSRSGVPLCGIARMVARGVRRTLGRRWLGCWTRLVQITLDRVGADQRLCRPAVRKGFAFPWRLHINQLPQRRLEGTAFQTTLRKRNGGAWPESRRLSAQRGGRAALATRRVLKFG